MYSLDVQLVGFLPNGTPNTFWEYKLRFYFPVLSWLSLTQTNWEGILCTLNLTNFAWLDNKIA